MYTKVVCVILRQFPGWTSRCVISDVKLQIQSIRNPCSETQSYDLDGVIAAI
jgi:hypothetical protein